MKYYCFNIFHRNICTNIDEKNCSARESVACSRSMKVTGEWIELRWKIWSNIKTQNDLNHSIGSPRIISRTSHFSRTIYQQVSYIVRPNYIIEWYKIITETII